VCGVFAFMLMLSLKTDPPSGSDSLNSQKRKLAQAFSFSGNLSGSFISYNNWKGNEKNSFFFKTLLCGNYDSTATKWESHVHLSAELSYLKYIDSTWNKNSDYLDIGVEFLQRRQKNITSTFNLAVYTQMISDYSFYYSDSGEYLRRWSGGFANPMSIDLVYGSAWRFWKTCRIDLGYVTLKSNVSPLAGAVTGTETAWLISKSSRMSTQYGFCLQTHIRHNFNKRFRWENQSRIFVNAIAPDHISLDLKNRVGFRIIKYLELILDTKVRYLPAPPYQFQFRNELALAFTVSRF
jgi:hypothetical protein